MTGAEAPTVLLVGDYRYTLSFVRSLAQAGFRVFVARRGSPKYAARSRFTAAAWEHPRIAGSGD